MDFVGAISKEIFSISWYWWIVIISLTAAIWRGKNERIVESLIAGYVFLILVITLLDRGVTINSYGQIKLIPFWSYFVPELKSEIICNYLLFVPFGFLIELEDVELWKVLLIGATTSLIIETLQMVLSRGLFEFDDILGNGIGCLLGAGIVIGFRRIKAK